MRIRTAESIKGIGGLKNAVIRLGNGNWEITNLSVAVGAFETGHVRIAYVYEDGSETVTDYLGSGPLARNQRPYIMNGVKTVKGPGNLTSIGTHDQNFAHTLTVQYRSVK